MWKLQSLRKLIESAVPDLKRDPERLIVMATDGAAVSTLAAGLSFEYRYTAAITVLDYTGHTDALFVPILAWARVNQSDVLDNPTSQRRGGGVQRGASEHQRRGHWHSRATHGTGHREGRRCTPHALQCHPPKRAMPPWWPMPTRTLGTVAARQEAGRVGHSSAG